MPIKPLSVSAYTGVNALGRGVDVLLSALLAGAGGLRPCDFDDAVLETWIGRVEGLGREPITGELGAFDCRNNRLARAALHQDRFFEAVNAARERYGAERVGVVVGTSTSGVLTTEQAYRDRDPATGQLPSGFNYQYTHNIFSLADFLRRYLKLTGPSLAVSTACSSSAKVFTVAYRYMAAGLCDAAVVAGVDSLCLTTLYGFNSLGLASSHPCRPWDMARDGLSIGEAAGVALLEWPEPGVNGVSLLGYGESSDAYHMSAADPEGTGATLAIQQALNCAGLEAAQVDYINLHGTATPSNDTSEDRAVVRVFGVQTPVSSTKGWTGHTLGAAGITEAVFSCLSIENGFMPGNLNIRRPDPKLSANVLLENRKQPVNVVLSNSFGFGGTNCCLLFGSSQ